MERFYYGSAIQDFLKDEQDLIFGKITKSDQFSATDLQKNTWLKEIEILKRELFNFKDMHVIFEYTIPRIGSRVDNVLIYKGMIFLLEFKIGEKKYPSQDIDQVVDYALDLSSFHKESHDKTLVPILISTEAKKVDNTIEKMKDRILEPLLCNEYNLGETIKKVASMYGGLNDIDPVNWINSLYMPTPTIIEAAKALYMGNNVEDISRSDAGAKNLNETTEAINRIIEYSKKNKKKSICFVTGVPGAGKTLAGLNIAVERQRIDEGEHAVFLSGNGPLVEVLQESLARDDVERNRAKKSEALRKAKEFIQIIHHFRDDAISVDTPPIEKVTIFDEAQRAWDQEHLSNFMKRKKGKFGFNMSEPEFLISILDRHEDWAVIICLIGGGQEINKGESDGISGWLDAIRENYGHWNVFISDRITDKEYSKDNDIVSFLAGVKYRVVEDLHLGVPLRSFRSEKVSDFVKAFLDVDKERARSLYEEFKDQYPIYITRDLNIAKNWIRKQAKGTERYGITASSGAKRLRVYGIWVQNKVDAPAWFLNSKDDVRSSYFMEEAATEFDIQGLELDWSVVCWDANLRFNENKFSYHSFVGTKWQNINKEEDALYLKNAYRVLMTRARQGFIIFLPKGFENDVTMKSEYYDGVYKYMKEIGVKEIEVI